jgi:hypothetical protein
MGADDAVPGGGVKAARRRRHGHPQAQQPPFAPQHAIYLLGGRQRGN